MTIIIIIGLFCLLLSIGYFVSDSPVGFAVKSLIFIGALLFLVVAFFVARVIIIGY
jgi:hypothetical protein